MDAEGDSPKDRGTAKNVGDITCPGQEKTGQKLIRAYANIATSVTLSNIKWGSSTGSSVPGNQISANWLKLILKPIVIIALLAS